MRTHIPMSTTTAKIMITATDPLSNRDTVGQEKTLFLLQVANSSFPTGAFNHSYGFETWFSDGSVCDAESFEIACRDWLVYCMARSEAIAVARATEMARLKDEAGLLDLDSRVAALKLSREAREASSMTGRALLDAYVGVFDRPGMERFAEAVQTGDAEGHHSVIFGAICGLSDISGTDAVLTFLQTAVSGLAGVASRLIPLGQVETQRIITHAWPLIQEASLAAVAADVDDMNAATMSLDVASMQHEHLRTRLCIS